MSGSPSLLLRLTRAVVGLSTLLCLGCDGYEPIVDAMRGIRTIAAVDCEAMMSPAAVGAPATERAATHVDATPSTIDDASTDTKFDCGCTGFCHAISLANELIAAAPMPAPFVAHGKPTEPSSVTRSPLLPPPQRAA